MLLILGLQILNVANHLQNGSTNTKDLFLKSFPTFDDNLFYSNFFKSLVSRVEDLENDQNSNQNYFRRDSTNENSVNDWSKWVSTERRNNRSFANGANLVVHANQKIVRKVYTPFNNNHGSEQLTTAKYPTPSDRAESSRARFDSKGRLLSGSYHSSNISIKPSSVELKNKTKRLRYRLRNYHRNHNVPNTGVTQHYRRTSPISSTSDGTGFSPASNSQYMHQFKPNLHPSNFKFQPRFQNNKPVDMDFGQIETSHDSDSSDMLYEKDNHDDEGSEDGDGDEIRDGVEDEDGDEDGDEDEDEDEEDVTEYSYKEDETPDCALETDHSYCDEDREYPEETMQSAIDNQLNLLTQIMPDSSETFDSEDEVSDDNQDDKYNYRPYLDAKSFSVDTNKTGELGEKDQNQLYYNVGGYICRSYVNYIQPKRAKNTNGMWRIIVNLEESYRGIDYKQHVRIEECVHPNSKCSFTANNHNSECIQIFNDHRLLAWTSDKGIHLDVFPLPIACSCHFKQTN